MRESFHTAFRGTLCHPDSERSKCRVYVERTLLFPAFRRECLVTFLQSHLAVDFICVGKISPSQKQERRLRYWFPWSAVLYRRFARTRFSPSPGGCATVPSMRSCFPREIHLSTQSEKARSQRRLRRMASPSVRFFKPVAVYRYLVFTMQPRVVYWKLVRPTYTNKRSKP